MLHLNCNFFWDFHFNCQNRSVLQRTKVSDLNPIGTTSRVAFPELYHFSKAGAVSKLLDPDQQINPKTGEKT
jgi:hypothetical protein